MVQDVYEPLARYRDEFRARHAALTREKFAAFVRTSGVDVAANRRTVSVIVALERRAGAVRTRRNVLAFLATMGFLAAAAGVGCLFLEAEQTMRAKALAVAGGVAALLFAVWMLVIRSRFTDGLRALESRIDTFRRRAWEQMAPLNALFTWDVPVKLVEATVPRLAFDPYFSARRLADLRRLCGWDDAFNEGRSVVGSQSGVINGNPFVFGDCLVENWGEETYTGSLSISWLEEEEDDEGHVHLVRRHETLHASVTKPCPFYAHDKVLIYGNDAAPNLTFTREPSDLSGENPGFWKSLRKRWALRRLEAFSRNLEDDSNYTIMANREFETLFETKNRDNEVEYRLLFTALAQIQMLALLNDRKVGYGDDFTFQKRHRINVLRATHLDEAELDTDPARFRHWSVDAAGRIFQTFNEKFFKDVYFSLAPILAIPLYQQTRPHADIWKGVVDEEPSSFWEHESIANYHGEEAFRPDDCATRCILKTRVLRRDDDGARVAVTAHGYRTEERVDYVSVWGGDGNLHEVPVHWDEYLPVSRTREMILTERANPASRFRAAFEHAAVSVFRRSIYSYL